MLALGIILVIIGFVSLPSRSFSGPAMRRNVGMDLQGVHATADNERSHPEWSRVVVRSLVSLVTVGAGVALIAIGS